MEINREDAGILLVSVCVTIALLIVVKLLGW